MSLRIDIIKQYDSESIQELFPQLEPVKIMHQMENNFEKSLIEAINSYRGSLNQLSLENAFQIETATRIFSILDDSIDKQFQTISTRTHIKVQQKPIQVQQKLTKPEEKSMKVQEKPIEKVTPEINLIKIEENKRVIKDQKTQLKNEKKTKDEKKERPSRKCNLLKKMKFQTSNEKPEIYTCIHCLIKSEKAVVKNQFEDWSEYVSHVTEYHELSLELHLNLISTVRKVCQNQKFSHLLFKGQLIRTLNSNLANILNILYNFKQKRYQTLYFCSCRLLSLNKNEQKYSAFLKEEEFLDHVALEHRSVNQANSTHNVVKIKNHIKVQRNRSCQLTSYFESDAQQKYFISLLQCFQVNFMHLRSSKAMITRNQKISKLEVISKIPFQFKQQLMSKCYQINYCSSCDLGFLSKAIFFRHMKTLHQTQQQEVFQNIDYDLKHAMLKISDLISDRRMIYNLGKIPYVKDQAGKVRKLIYLQNRMASEHFYHCGFCEGLEGYFDDLPKYVYHISVKHQDLHEMNSHIVRSGLKENDEEID